MTITLERRRTGWDIVLGLVLVILGFMVLGNAVLATAVSVLWIAWLTLISGVMMIIVALVSIRAGLSWSTLLGGAALAVLGLFMLRNPLVAAIALTMMAGAIFFVTGVVRIGLAFTVPAHKWVFILGGLVSIVLALWILLNPAAATLKLLGILLGVQVLSEGITLILSGRLRIVDATATKDNVDPATQNAAA